MRMPYFATDVTNLMWEVDATQFKLVEVLLLIPMVRGLVQRRLELE